MHRHWPRLQLRAVTSLGLLFAVAASALAAPPWAQLVPFRSSAGPAPVRTASATVDYSLNEKHGPWMIMVTSFVTKPDDENSAEHQAQELVKELRTRHRMQAFVFRQEFDFSSTETGLGFNRFGGAKKMKPLQPKEFTEVAVMVGNFDSVNDPDLEATLKSLKKLEPACLMKAVNPKAPQQKVTATQSMGARFANYYRDMWLKKDDPRRNRGPLGRAFVTRNPLLPDEYFVAKGLDPFVVEMNKSLPHSLLKNPKKYTVKVATFRGVDSMKPAEFEEKVSTNAKSGKGSKIDIAAENASQLCAALRKQGVEAYEFHDISESIVTIGSFDSVGSERVDGKTEINRAVLNIMEQYKAEQKPIPGYADLGVVPKQCAGINFDAQPMPVEVPRQSLAANYNANNGVFR